VIDDVYAQIAKLRGKLDPPGEVTHVALSVGGNDLLGISAVLNRRAGTVADAVLMLSEESSRFGTRYRALLDAVTEVGLPTVVCTVYGGAFDDPAEAATIETALRVFDHEILSAGLDRGLPVVDLRRACSSADDYWNPIEPSERGGAKIAAAVLAAFRAPRYEVGGPPVTVQGTGGLAG
jgi:hypothetical protein